MKTIKSLKFAAFAALLVFSSTLIFAQTNYKQSLSIGKDGKVKNEKGVGVGIVTKDQIIKDANGKKVAFLAADGTLKDANGKTLGKMAKNNSEFYDESGVLVLKIKDNPDETCDIIDVKGNVVGNVHDSLKGVACAVHCFHKDMAKKAEGSHMKH
ncbi:5-fold beta-flower protein [Runella sp.]|uniref:5-fold beta-flower protein n=1 Tax=Runella sp. TaxID=1960881 RepID=UPI003D0B8799